MLLIQTDLRAARLMFAHLRSRAADPLLGALTRSLEEVWANPA